MTALKLSWNGDLELTQNGGLATVDGLDEVIERIERRVLTNSKTVLPFGDIVPADYIFHSQYGLSFRAFVQGVFTKDMIAQIKQIVTKGIKMDTSVDPRYDVTVTFNQPSKDRLYVKAEFKLLNGSKGTVSFSIGSQVA